MAVAVCPSCHERFRYDSRAELEVVAMNAAPDGGLLTFRSDQRVIHECVNPPSDRGAERETRQDRQRAGQVT
jgi:hypothetical protein